VCYDAVKKLTDLGLKYTNIHMLVAEETFEDCIDYKMYSVLAESCESTLFSLYINVNGKCFPCSFLEDEEDYNGIDVVECDDFLKDIWNHPDIALFRENLLNTVNKGEIIYRKCPKFKI